MQNVVSLRSDRPRPRRIPDVPRSGAQILLFTGVRYCRQEDAPEPLPAIAACGALASERPLDATSH